MSRVDLEREIGRVLTNGRAARALQTAPETYVTTLDQLPAERDSLIAMSGSLVGLMPGFLGKRRGMLTKFTGRTLRLLGETGTVWLREFVDEVPPVEVSKGDGLQWIDWLIARVQTEPNLPHRELLLDSVRLEKRVYQTIRTPAGLDDGRDRAMSVDAELRLHPSADLIHVGWDLLDSSDATAETIDSIVAADLDLFVFRNKRGRAIIEPVLDPDLFDALLTIAAAPTDLTTLLSMSENPDLLSEQLTRLFRFGALIQ